MRVNERAEAGIRGEALVSTLLEERGFRILGRNIRVGRDELDIVAMRDQLVVVCEVRTRSSRGLVRSPAETIDRAKIGRVRRAAARFLSSEHLSACEIRFDAAAVLLDTTPPEIAYYEHAF